MTDGICIVDDDDAVRDSLSMLVLIKGYRPVAFASAEAFLAGFDPKGSCCVIADVCMRGMSGIEMLERLRETSPDLPVIIITAHGDVPTAVAAMKAGAADFIEKPYDNVVLLERIRQVVAQRDQGGLSSEVVRGIRERIDQLSRREREVLDLVATGVSNKVIAGRLGVSTRTVEIHRAHMMEKMGAEALSDLIRMVTTLDILSHRGVT
ncbi:MAG: response regulator [Rhodospirillaceae bacterium]